MATVIDQLIVELQLDPKKFSEGQREAMKDLRRMETEAGKHQQRLAQETDRYTQSLGLLQGKLLAIAAIFTGGMGIENFLSHIMTATSQTGYLAKSLGVTTKELGTWQAMAPSVGASAAEMTQGFTSIKNALADWQINRAGPLANFSWMTHQTGNGPAVDISPSDDVSTVIEKMTKWHDAQIAAGQSPAVINKMIRDSAGLPQGMINAIGLGSEGLKNRLKQFEQFAPTEDDAKKFQELSVNMAAASQQAEKLGRAIALLATPGVIRFLEALNRIVEAFTKGGFIAGLSQLEEEASKGVGEATKSVGVDASAAGEKANQGWWGRFKSKFEWYNPFARPMAEQERRAAEEGTTANTVGMSGDGPGGASAPTGANTRSSDSGAPGMESTRATGWWTPERKQQSVDYLMKNAGLPEISARALVARWAGVESTQGGAGEVNSIGAQGIAQWLGKRQGGYQMGDLDSQLAHVVRELKTTEGPAYQALMSAQNAREAAIGASRYERAEGYNPRTGEDNFVDKTVAAMSGVPGAPGAGGKPRVNFMGGAFPSEGDLVTITTNGGKKVRVNRESAPQFLGFLNDMEAAGAPIKSIGGHNHRMQANGRRWSQHAYGNAIDVNMTGRNVTTGGLKKWADENPEKLSEIEKRWGMVSGAKWRNPDFGHWEWGGVRPNLINGSRGALAGGNHNVNNSRSSTTNIENMHVSTPPGASPGEYASGIQESLQRNGAVSAANEGLW